LNHQIAEPDRTVDNDQKPENGQSEEDRYQPEIVHKGNRLFEKCKKKGVVGHSEEGMMMRRQFRKRIDEVEYGGGAEECHRHRKQKKLKLPQQNLYKAQAFFEL
jgi:hypothetical protein